MVELSSTRGGTNTRAGLRIANSNTGALPGRGGGFNSALYGGITGFILANFTNSGDDVDPEGVAASSPSLVVGGGASVGQVEASW